MAVQQSHIQKKGSQSVPASSIPSAFQSRPFEPLQAEIDQTVSNPNGHSFASTLRVTPPDVQAKLTIGQPNDKYEQEADQVAAQVVSRLHTPEPVALPKLQSKATVRRKSNQPVQRSQIPTEQLQMKPAIQRRSQQEGMAASTHLESSIDQARGGGQSLSNSIRQPLEQLMGANFGGVKVHTDARADQLSRSINAQAFTTKNDIFFSKGKYDPGSRDGQTLLAHELTHVMQQNSAVQRSTIQCKRGNIDALPSDIVGTSSWYRTSKESEKIQKNILDYNKIKDDDKNYANQRKLLTEIISLCDNWLKNNGNNQDKADKLQPIANASLEAELELSQVEQQEQQGDGQNDYKQRTDGVGADIGDVASNARTGIAAGVSEQSRKKVGAVGAIAGDGKSLAEQTKSLFEAAKNSAETDTSLLDESNANTKSIVENYRNLSGLTTVAKDGTVGAKIMSFGNALMNWAFVGSVLGIAKSIYDAYTLWGEWQSFSQAQKDLKANQDKGESASAALQDAIDHGYGKVKRRFWSVMSTVVSKVVDVVSYILIATGVGAAVGAIMQLSIKLLETLALLGRKIKGLWKFISKSRGAHRSQSADTLVQSALRGDKIALQILVDIDPIGAIGRAKIGAKNGLDVAKADQMGKFGKAGMATFGAAYEVLAGDSKVKTPDQMQEYLLNIKEDPSWYNININEFTAAVSEKLKSQA